MFATLETKNRLIREQRTDDVRPAALDVVADQNVRLGLGAGAGPLDLLASTTMRGINQAGTGGGHSIGPADLVDEKFMETIQIVGDH